MKIIEVEPPSHKEPTTETHVGNCRFTSSQQASASETPANDSQSAALATLGLTRIP